MLCIELDGRLAQGICHGGLPQLVDKPSITAQSEQCPLILQEPGG
jgi:hypothetical protein